MIRTRWLARFDNRGGEAGAIRGRLLPLFPRHQQFDLVAVGVFDESDDIAR
jgi:hypothetical protein